MYKLFFKNQFYYIGTCIQPAFSLMFRILERLDIIPQIQLRLSWEEFKCSYINWMILSVTEFFPTSWARVSISKGVTEALTAENMTTFGCHDKSSTLYNLEGKKNELEAYKTWNLVLQKNHITNLTWKQVVANVCQLQYRSVILNLYI